MIHSQTGKNGKQTEKKKKKIEKMLSFICHFSWKCSSPEDKSIIRRNRTWIFQNRTVAERILLV